MPRIVAEAGGRVSRRIFPRDAIHRTQPHDCQRAHSRHSSLPAVILLIGDWMMHRLLPEFADVHGGIGLHVVEGCRVHGGGTQDAPATRNPFRT